MENLFIFIFELYLITNLALDLRYNLFTFGGCAVCLLELFGDNYLGIQN